MRRLLLPVLLLLTACSAGPDRVATESPAPASPMPVDLVVETAYGPGADGQLYSEGAVAEVRLVDATGSARTVTGPSEGELVFEDVVPGRYVLEPGLRACIANCDNLADDRTETCTEEVAVERVTRVRVDFAVGSDCEVVVEGA